MKKGTKRILKMTTVLGNGKEDDFPPPLTNSVMWYLKYFFKKEENKLLLGQHLEIWETTLLTNSGNLAPCEAVHRQHKNNRACGLIWYSQ